MIACNHRSLADVEFSDRFQEQQRLRDVRAVLGVGLPFAEHARRHQDFRRYFMGADQPEAFLLEGLGHAGQKMIVAAAIGGHYPRQYPQRPPIEAYPPEWRPGDGADEDNLAAAFGARLTADPTELAERAPVMPVSRDAFRFGPSAQRKHHYVTAAS